MLEVFLSYSHRDKVAAETLCRIIEQRRSVFFDRRRLKPGAKWEPALRRALQTARCVVVLWSEASVKSDWVRREAREGLMRDVLIPVRIADTAIPAEFEEFQAADLVGWHGADSEALQLILARIDEVVRLPPKTPDAVAEEWTGLVARLDTALPHKIPSDNLLVATWNVKAFGQLTSSWTASEEEAPKRDKRAVLAIAEIISRFDIMMLTDVRGNWAALRAALDFLGDDWSVICTDAQLGVAGNIERVAFCFDTRRVLPAGIVDSISPTGMSAFLQLDGLLTEPMYSATFRTRFSNLSFEFTLVVFHFAYGMGHEVNAEATATIRALAAWVKAWSNSESRSGRALLFLGDFDPNRRGDLLYDAFADHFSAHDEIHSMPSVVISSGEVTAQSASSKFYDQVNWFGNDPGGPSDNLRHRACGIFNFVGAVHNELSARALSYRLSDHYPVWVEFSTPHSN